MKTPRLIPRVLGVFAVFAIANLQGAPETYFANLNGPSESPPNLSPGTGSATVTIDPVTNTLSVMVMFAGLTSGTTASHIHAATPSPFSGTAGVATAVPTFPGFPLGVTSGVYTMTFDMMMASTWNPTYVTAHGGSPAGAEAAFIAAVRSGEAYLNIHTTNFPGGEIRGFLVPAPEAATTWSLMLISVGALVFLHRRLRCG